MKKWSRDNHSLEQTLEKLDNDPNVVMGLTGNELFIVSLSLQGLSLITVFPLIGFVTGIWILAICLSMCIGVLGIVIVGKRIAKMKEAEGGASDIVSLNIKIKIFNFIGRKTGIMTAKERWSCDRTTRINK